MRVWALMLVHVVGAIVALWAGMLCLELRGVMSAVMPRTWPVVVAAVFSAALLCLFAARAAWRAKSAPGLCWRALLYVVVAAWAVELFVWKREQPLFDAWTLAAAAAAHAAICLLARKRGARVQRWVRWGDVAAMNVVVFLALGEAGFRLLAAVRPSPLFVAPGTTELDWIVAHAAVPGRRRADIRVNSLGYFDQEFLRRDERSRPMVLVIGDSFSTGVVPHARHYTTVAERALGDADLYNLGVAAIGPREYLYLWRTEGRALEPDRLVVSLFVGNDLLDRAAATEPVSWRDPQSSIFFRALHRTWLVVSETRRREGRGEVESGDRGGARRDEPYREPEWTDDPRLEPPTFSPERYLEIEKARAIAICRPGRDQKFEQFTVVLEEIVDAAGDVPLAIVLIPDEFQVEEALWEQVRGSVTGRLERDLPQQRIVAWLAERGVPCLDLLPTLRALPVEADGKRHAYHLQDTHWNARGNRCAGEAIAAFLRPLLEKSRTR